MQYGLISRAKNCFCLFSLLSHLRTLNRKGIEEEISFLGLPKIVTQAVQVHVLVVSKGLWFG